MRNIIIALFALTACSNDRPVGQSQTKVKVADEPVPELRIPDDQAALLTRAHEGLADLATLSPSAKGLMAFYDAHALPAIGLSDGMLQVVTAPKDFQHDFFVVASTAIARVEPGGSAVFASFDCYPNRALVIRNVEAPGMMQGLLLAHELVHAQDCVLHGEPPSEPLSETWLIGEIRAHVMVGQVLDEYTNGGWSRLVEETRLRHVQLAALAGKPAEASYIGLVAEDIAALRALLGEIDQNTLNMVGTQLDIEANLVNIVIQGQNLGKSEDEIRNYSVNYAHAFFSQHAL